MLGPGNSVSAIVSMVDEESPEVIEMQLDCGGPTATDDSLDVLATAVSELLFLLESTLGDFFLDALLNLLCFQSIYSLFYTVRTEPVFYRH